MKNTLRDWLWAFKKNKKAQLITGIVVGLLLILVIVYAVLARVLGSNNDNTNDGDVALREPVAQVGDEAARRLDGVEVDLAVSNLLPKAIVVENFITTRPQSGLNNAQLVYETLAEGGITRFMAVYSSDDVVEKIGPVRSARHYFVDLAEEYGGIFAHIGGSPQALGILGSTEFMTDLNQFGYSQYYYRDENIGAPHNLFTTSELMEFSLRDLGLEDEEGTYDPYLFKQDVERKDRPEVSNTINIDFSSFDYSVDWEYDRETNSYVRDNGGEDHVDANTGEQVTAKNVVVQWVETSLLETDSGRIDVTTVGDGEAILFQDGVAYEGTWEKAERGERTKFYDAEGNEFEFNPGTTWLELVPVGREVTY